MVEEASVYQVNEVINVTSARVKCQGERCGETQGKAEGGSNVGNGEVDVLKASGYPMGHPLIYLNINNEDGIKCPYCSRHFILVEKEGKSL